MGSLRKKNGQFVSIFLKDNEYTVINELAALHNMEFEDYLKQLVLDGYTYYRRGEELLSKAIENGEVDGTWLGKLHDAVFDGKRQEGECVKLLRQAIGILKGTDTDEWVRVLQALRNGVTSETLAEYQDITLEGRHMILGRVAKQKEGFLQQKEVGFETLNPYNVNKEND